jgi:hypothetical protein
MFRVIIANGWDRIHNFSGDTCIGLTPLVTDNSCDIQDM